MHHRLQRLAACVAASGLLFLGATSAAAQPRRAPEVAPHSTYLSAGRMGVSVHYRGHKTGREYVFEGAARALAVGAEDAQLLVAYGAMNGEGLVPAARYYEASLGAGGNSYLVERIAGAPVGAYVPIRIGVSYRGVHPRETTLTPDPDRLHLLSGSLQAGVGIRVRSPRALPALEDRLVVLMWQLYGAGMYGDVATNFDDGGLQGVREFNVDARVEGLFGARAGLTFGYTHRRQHLASGKPEKAQEVLDALLDPSSAGPRQVQHMLRIGICF